METTNTLIGIGKLNYDVENPRLPEYMLNKTRDELASYYYDYAVVNELAESMLQNGFFPHEPLIVRQSEKPDEYVVVEGNRRLTALFLIHKSVSTDAGFGEIETEKLSQLHTIPCVISDNPESTRKYIGFRHISGPKEWQPAEKARFVTVEVEAAKERGVSNPFAEVAKAVGSSAQKIRGYYMALKLLKHAQSEASADTSQIQSKRFGVWDRLVTVPGFKSYIGLNLEDNSCESVDLAIKNTDLNKLVETVNDLRSEPNTDSILNDSRDATNYGRVLMNESARKVLRTYNDLQAAITIVDDEIFADKVDKVCRKVEALIEDVRGADYSTQSEDAVKRLISQVRDLHRLTQKPTQDELF